MTLAHVHVILARFLGFVKQPVVIVCAAVIGSGCLPYEAKNLFSGEFSCPSERISIEERPDLARDTVLPGYQPHPPDDIQADPERLALYLKNTTPAQPERVVKDSGSYYHVRGCGRDAVIRCNRWQNGHYCDDMAVKLHHRRWGQPDPIPRVIP